MVNDKPAGSASELLVSNTSCSIESQGSEDVLICQTRGKKGTIGIFALGIALIYGSIGLIAWHLPGGNLNPASLTGGFIALVLGLLLQWRGMRRHNELGRYQIDRLSRTIRKQDTSLRYTFEDAVFVRLAIDVTGGIRSSLSYWLFIHFKDGRQFRIGRGTKAELKRTMVWLKMNGLPIALDD